MAVNAGDLRETVAIESPTYQRNAVGEMVPVEPWTIVARRRASVQAVAYNEQRQLSQMGGSASHLVTMRFLEGMTGGMRLRWESRGGRLLYVSSVVETGNREGLEVYAEERV
jgi:head-tail adaptor